MSIQVLNLLDAQSLMSSVHPFWKHFETLFQNILNPDKTKATKADKDERSKSSPFLGFGAAKVTAFSPSENDNEMTLQKMLDLDSLAKVQTTVLHLLFSISRKIVFNLHLSWSKRKAKLELQIMSRARSESYHRLSSTKSENTLLVWK